MEIIYVIYVNLQQEYRHTKSMMDIVIVAMVLMNGLKLQCCINSVVSSIYIYI